MKKIIRSMLMRGGAALSPIVRSRIGCALSPPGLEYQKNEFIKYNRSYSTCVIQEQPELTMQTCIFDPRYNGVYAEDGCLISGSALIRGRENKHFNAPRTINIDEERSVIPTAIYGGILFANHYGHFLTETMSRLWPLLEGELKGQGSNIPIIFRMAGQQKISLDKIAPFAKATLQALGIFDRIVIPDAQICVKNMIIPHASIINNCKVHSVYAEFMREVGCRLLDHSKSQRRRSTRKIYLSRSQLPQNCRHLANERCLERILLTQGYVVLHPQKMTFIEQVRMFSEAEEIVGPVGSAFHTLPLAGNSDILIKYLVGEMHSKADRSTYNNIDAALGINSMIIHCMYSHKLSMKETSFQDQILDVDRAIEAINRARTLGS